jgi:hypothetical protein
MYNQSVWQKQISHKHPTAINLSTTFDRPVQFQNLFHATIFCKKGRKHQVPLTWDINPTIKAIAEIYKKNTNGKADNVSPPKWSHFLAVWVILPHTLSPLLSSSPISLLSSHCY